jgi:hypothetical protein
MRHAYRYRANGTQCCYSAPTVMASARYRGRERAFKAGDLGEEVSVGKAGEKVGERLYKHRGHELLTKILRSHFPVHLLCKRHHIEYF